MYGSVALIYTIPAGKLYCILYTSTVYLSMQTANSVAIRSIVVPFFKCISELFL